MIFLLFLFLFSLFSCQKHPNFVFLPDKTLEVEKQDLSWVGKIGRMEMFRTSQLSFHIVKLEDGEKPHFHMNHDLFVIVLKGYGTFFIGEKKYEMKDGDSAFVPKGVKHYFVPKSKKVYAVVVFNPPFDGMDNVLINE